MTMRPRGPHPGNQQIYIPRYADGVPLNGLFLAAQGKSIIANCADCNFRESLGRYPTVSDVIRVNGLHIERAKGFVCTRGVVVVVP